LRKRPSVPRCELARLHVSKAKSRAGSCRATALAASHPMNGSKPAPTVTAFSSSARRAW